MKKVIEGKVYNTETATKIANDSYGRGNDFSAWTETLCKTKKGIYFLYGKGGPMSHYSVQLGNNNICGGSRLIPMSKEEAYTWMEEHGIDADIILGEFPDLEEA